MYDVGEVNRQLPLGGQEALPGTLVDLALTTGTINDPPTIGSDPVTAHTVGSEYGYDVDATDPDGDSLTYVLQAGPTNDAGALLATIDANTGEITWSPTPGNAGSHDFAVRVSDGRGGIDVQSFTLEVTVANRAPDAVDDVLTATAGESLPIAAATLLANDTDPDEDELTVSGYTQPRSGRVTGSNADLTYTPNDPVSATAISTDVELTEIQPVTITSDKPSQAAYPIARLNDASTTADWFTISSSACPHHADVRVRGRRGVASRRPVRIAPVRRPGIRGAGGDDPPLDAPRDAGGVVVFEEVGLETDDDPDPDDDVDADTSFDLVPLNGGNPITGVRAVEVVITRVGTQNYPGLSEVDLHGDAPVALLAPKLEWAELGIGAQTVPLVADLDGDGVPEVVYNALNGELRARRGDSGAALWTRPVAGPGESGAEQYGTPVVADFTDDPGLEVVHPATTATILRLVNAEGAVREEFPASLNFAEGNLAAADVDGDGQPEIIAGGDGRLGVYNVNPATSELSTRWVSSSAWGCGRNTTWPYCTPVVVDIDLDGRLEIITGRRIADAATGASQAVAPDANDGFVGVANFDDDPEGEIVRVYAGALTIFNHDFSIEWGPVPLAAPNGSTARGRGGPPTIADFDGDGRPEIGVAGELVYAVYDPDTVLDADPATEDAVLWKSPIDDTTSSSTGSTVFDFDNDGRAEVVYADQDFIRVYDGPSGAIRWQEPNGSNTRSEAPVVADVDGDGQAEIVVTSERATTYLGTTYPPGIRVYGSPADNWVRARSIWNQHQYDVVNVNADGTIPAVPEVNWLDGGLNNFRQQAFLADDPDRLDRFSYTVADPDGTTDTATVFVDVVAPENDPVITCGPPQTATIGFELRGRICADDADGDTLTFATELNCVASAAPRGNDNPWLAGMPDGTTLAGDRAGPDDDDNSPLLVEFPCGLAPGEALTFDATGSSSFGGSNPPSSPTDGTSIVSHPCNFEIASVIAPADSLLGVFLTDVQPSNPPVAACSAGAPTGLAFSTPEQLDYRTLAPMVGQPFFIGNGVASDGVAHQVEVPPGATRLFLGSMDGFGWFNNTGGFDVRITPSTPVEGFTIDPVVGTFDWRPTTEGVYELLVIVTDASGRQVRRTYPMRVTAPAEVPGVVGAERLEAEGDIAAADLRVGTVTLVNDAAVAGTVIEQFPPGGTVAEPQSRVDLVVSSGPAPGDEDVDGDTFSPNQGDCDDTDTAVNPSAEEIDNDGIDSDCDGIDGVPPALTRLDLTPTTPVIRVGETFAVTARAVFDDDTTADVTALGVWTTVDSAVVGVDGRGRVSGLAAGSGTIKVTYSGVQGEVVVTVRAPGPVDRTPPTATITAPDAGVEVTEPVDVVGTATDVDLLRWTLDLVDGDEVVAQVATATDGVANGLLGRLDPTVLINGSYELLLTVVDVTGNTSTARQPITITGKLKVGTFALSFTDLVVPAPGLPIEIRRDYDTRDDQLGDFGYGWRLGLSNLRVSSSGTQGEGWAIAGGGFRYLLQPTRPHTITVVLPDGTTEEFDATTTPSATAFVPPSAAVMGYRARPGTSGRLEPTGNRNVLIFGGLGQDAELVDDTTFRTWDPRGFRYTAADGTRFTLNADGQVSSITDPAGNVITIDSDGISHSAGSSVLFERDALERITAIVDGAGNRQTYSYDSVGDLVAHTDGEGVTTRFRYTGSHDMVEIVGAGGVGVRRLDYDDDGRLIRLDDGDGYVLEFDHDVDARREVITDANGNPNVLGYDDQGNVIEQIDAEGRTSSFTYDARGNLLTRDEPGLATESFTYDARDRIIESVDAAGGTTTYTYVGTSQRIATVIDPLGDVTTFTYDAAGQVLTRTSPASSAAYSYDSRGLLRTAVVDGATSIYDYDARGNLIAERLADGSTNTFEVNGAGAVTAIEDVDGRTELEVNSSGLPVTVTTESGDVSTLSYGPSGLLTGVTTPDGTQVVETLDARGRPTEIRRDGALIQGFVYRPDGLLASQVDPAGTTTFDYDRAGRQIAVVDPAGRRTTFGYGPGDQPTTITDAGGAVTTLEYDSAGRATAVTDATGRTQRLTYDDVGNVVRVVDAAGLVSETVFDAGRPVRITSPGGAVRTIDYDTSGRQVEIVDEEGHVTRTTYDSGGRPATITDAAGGTTSYVYSVGADLEAVIDPLGRTTRYEHDAAGRVIGVTHPDGTSLSMTRDLDGQVTSSTDAAGRTSTFAYSDDGDLTSAAWSDGSVEQRTYDDAGNLLSARLDDEVVEFTYSPTGSILSSTQPGIGSITYVEDAVGRVAEAAVTLDGLGTTTTRYGYDLAGRLTSVDGPEGLTAIGYDAGGRRSSAATPDGTTSTLAYGSDGLLSSLVVTNGADVLLDEQVQRDLRGDITRIDRPGSGSSTFAYDPVRRLLEESHVDGAGEVTAWIYGYDAAGNRVTETGPDGSIDLELDVMDRLVSRDGQARRYDVAGNLIGETDGADERLYAFDARDLLTGVADADEQVAYDVDALGRRTGRDGEQYLIDMRTPTGLSEVVAVRDADGPTATRTTFADSALSTSGPDGTTFWHADVLGTAAVLTDQSGAVTDRRTTSAFGTLIDRTGTGELGRLFESQPIDPLSGLTHLRARDYDTATGLFNAVDPLALSSQDPGARMRYAYGLQNPLAYEDLTGLFATLTNVQATFAIQGVIGAAVGGAISAATGKGFVKGAIFGAISGLASAAAGLGVAAGAAAIATRSAGTQIISKLAQSGLLDKAVAVGVGLTDAFIGLVADYKRTGDSPDWITITVTFVASIGVALGFRNSRFANDFARELDVAVREVADAAWQSARGSYAFMAIRLRNLSNAGLVSIEEVLAVTGRFGVEIVERATRQALGPQTFDALAGVVSIGTELLKKLLTSTPNGLDAARGK